MWIFKPFAAKCSNLKKNKLSFWNIYFSMIFLEGQIQIEIVINSDAINICFYFIGWYDVAGYLEIFKIKIQ